MSTWEERMATRARSRIEAENAARRTRAEAEWQETCLRMEEASRNTEAYLAGPPSRCAECWVWARGFTWYWAHNDPTPHTRVEHVVDESDGFEYDETVCSHPCHGPGEWRSGPPVPLAIA